MFTKNSQLLYNTLKCSDGCLEMEAHSNPSSFMLVKNDECNCSGSKIRKFKGTKRTAMLSAECNGRHSLCRYSTEYHGTVAVFNKPSQVFP
mmetsp:Transcript_449/g.883  ORF Transcript_449/g.883 Transcript_449/m.883 type:complete len:91 (-) Transcript_449:157-429(-)